MSEFNDVTCPTCGHTYGYHAWQEMQQQREEIETARHIRDFAKLTRTLHARMQAEMPEPTIDEMLEYADGIQPRAMRWAIRAILEQYEKSGSRVIYDYHPNELEAIRAFVERVE